MRGIHGAVKKKGGEIVAVGNGSAKQAKAFRAEQDVPFPLLTDPSLKTYRAAGLASGVATTFAPSSAVRAAKAVAGGFIQGRTQGHAFQQGGAFVFAKGGRELFAYRSRTAGDHPDPKELIAALPTIS